jgi:hypothetical protein
MQVRYRLPFHDGRAEDVVTNRKCGDDHGEPESIEARRYRRSRFLAVNEYLQVPRRSPIMLGDLSRICIDQEPI